MIERGVTTDPVVTNDTPTTVRPRTVGDSIVLQPNDVATVTFTLQDGTQASWIYNISADDHEEGLELKAVLSLVVFQQPTE